MQMLRKGSRRVVGLLRKNQRFGENVDSGQKAAAGACVEGVLRMFALTAGEALAESRLRLLSVGCGNRRKSVRG